MNCYNDFGTWLRSRFPFKVQKISVDGGFTCPNRDGSISRGGCAFCDNSTFSPEYCRTKGIARPITVQIEEGKQFFSRKYPEMKYIAYFQAYTGTYAPLDELKRKYEEALSVDGVVGIAIGTRPDCVDERKLDYFATLARDRYVAIEYGVESTSDVTLRRINRGHDYAAARRAIALTAERGIHTGAHFILGLPGEPRQMLIDRTAEINALPLTTVKFHQLQLFRGTPLAAEYDAEPEKFRFWSVDEYIDLFIEILRRLRPDLVVERFAGEAPPRFHHAEGWGLIRNETLLGKLDRRLEELDAHQGDLLDSINGIRTGTAAESARKQK